MTWTFAFSPTARSRACTAAGLLFTLGSLPAVASAEEEGAAPIEYQVIEEPQPATDQPPPPPPQDYGQGQPAYGQPAPAPGPVVAAPVVTAEPGAAVAPVQPPVRTGVGGGLFFSYSPQGRVANYDSSSSLVATGDFPSAVGFGGHIMGLGRHFGGGAKARITWIYDTNIDSTWSMTDIEGFMRGRGRWGRFEFYGEMLGGFAVQRLTFTDTSGSYSDSSGGLTFGAGLGFRVFANDFLSFFIEPGMHWRIFFQDVTGGSSNTLGIRQFNLEVGINFGA